MPPGAGQPFGDLGLEQGERRSGRGARSTSPSRRSTRPAGPRLRVRPSPRGAATGRSGGIYLELTPSRAPGPAHTRAAGKAPVAPRNVARRSPGPSPPPPGPAPGLARPRPRSARARRGTREGRRGPAPRRGECRCGRSSSHESPGVHPPHDEEGVTDRLVQVGRGLAREERGQGDPPRQARGQPKGRPGFPDEQHGEGKEREQVPARVGPGRHRHGHGARQGGSEREPRLFQPAARAGTRSRGRRSRRGTGGRA